MLYWGLFIFFVICIYFFFVYIVFLYIMKPRHINFFGKNENNIQLEENCIDSKSILSFDNTQLKAYYMRKENSKDLMIIIHGYGSSSKNMVTYSNYFLQKGYSVLVPDLRAHGRSEGKYSGFSQLDSDDLKSWIDEFKDDYKISLFGLSMGGLTALRTLIKYPKEKIKLCITDSAPYSMRLIVEKVFNWKSPIKWKCFEWIFGIYLKVLLGILLEDSIKEDLWRLRVPIIMIHGKKDGLVPYSMCVEMYEKIQISKELVLLENTDHTQSFQDDSYWSKIDEFILKHR